jgi:DNA polymerase
MATVHPAAVLRDRSDGHRETYKLFVDDLRQAATGVDFDGGR